MLVGTVLSHGGSLSLAMRTATSSSPMWVAASVALTAMTFLASGLGMVGASRRRVTLPLAAAVELAGAFCNRITPAGVGRTLLRVRYLRRAGLSLEAAGSAVAVASLVGGAVHAAGIGLAGLAAVSFSGAAPTGPKLPSMVVLFAAAAVLAALYAVATASGSARAVGLKATCTARGRALRVEMALLRSDPSALMRLAAGHVLASVAYIGAFWAAGRAVGLGIGLSAAALVYLVGTAAASAVPVPGGVGPAEMALTAGLTAAGAPPAPALAAVLVFRLASFWLPTVAGAVALAWLHRQGVLHRPEQVPARSAHTDKVQNHDTIPTAFAAHGGDRTAETPPSPTEGESVMRSNSNGGRDRLSTTQKVLLAAGAALAFAVVGTGAAYASAVPPVPAPAASQQQQQQQQPSTSTPDTDNVQSGDQTGPDKIADKETAGESGYKAADTDNVQAGDQTGPDTGGSVGAG